jgi:hypothetical protein
MKVQSGVGQICKFGSLATTIEKNSNKIIKNSTIYIKINLVKGIA